MFCPRYFFGGRHFCTNAHGIHWMIGIIFVEFSQLIFMKIIKIVATRYQIFKNKMYQIQFRLGLRPRPCWGNLQRSRYRLAGFKGPTSKGRGEESRECREGRRPLYFFGRIYAHAKEYFTLCVIQNLYRIYAAELCQRVYSAVPVAAYIMI